MRNLLDTNVLVSALLTGDGPSGRILTAIRNKNHVLVSSPYLLNELHNVCRRPHLRERITQLNIEELLSTVVSVGVVASNLLEVQISPDPKDNPILATAIAGKADLIVSGDKSDMVALGHVDGIPILSPREALDRIVGTESD